MVNLPTDPAARADAELERLQDRLREAQQAASAGDGSAAGAALAAYSAILLEAEQGSNGNAAASAAVEAGVARHVVVLTQLLDEVPATARAAIEHALASSIKFLDDVDEPTINGGNDGIKPAQPGGAADPGAGGPAPAGQPAEPSSTDAPEEPANTARPEEPAKHRRSRGARQHRSPGEARGDAPRQARADSRAGRTHPTDRDKAPATKHDAGMRLSVVGAGPAYTDRPGAIGAAYLLRLDGSSLLLDFGQGAFPGLAAHLDPGTLDAVVISHLHPDHFIDLVPLRHYLRWEEPRRRVRVIGPSGLVGRLDALHDEPGFAATALDVEALAEGRRDVGAFELEAARVRHTDSSFGFRVAPRAGAGATPGLVYSGDCGHAEDLDALARPGDTLLCEVSFGPGPVIPGAEHLDGPAVGETRPSGGRRPGPAHAPADGLRQSRDHGERASRLRRARRAGRSGLRDDHRGLKTTKAPHLSVERLGRTPLGVATHEWGRLVKPTGRRPLVGSAAGRAKA